MCVCVCISCVFVCVPVCACVHACVPTCKRVLTDFCFVTYTSRLDQVQLLELLPKLAATIPKADRASLKALQRKCEPAFTEMIGLGVCTTVRQTI